MSHDDWLALTIEAPLEPELEICDPHHHLWDRADSTYLLDDLLADTGSGHRVASTVFVECMAQYRSTGPEELKPVGETAFVEGVADEAIERGESTTACLGIVGFADLLLGDGVEPVLEAHLEASPSRFKGIRHAGGFDASDAVRNSHTDPPPDLYRRPSFRRGFAVLDRLGMSFDAWQYHHQLGEVTDLARAFPDVVIVLDHVGGPLGIGPWAGHRNEILVEWKRSIDELAACGNVVVKLGGLGMPICGFEHHKRDKPPGSEELARAWRPYIEHCIDRFSPRRCMFESNFPVDKRSCSYTVLWNAFKRIAAHHSPDDKAALFRETAERAYRLGG